MSLSISARSCLVAVALLGASSAVRAADFTWNTGIGSWFTAGNWIGGVPAAGGNVFIDGDNFGNIAIVTLTGSASIGNLAIDGGDQLQVSNGSFLSLSGGNFTNAGTLGLNSAGFFTDLRFDADTTLSGNGFIALSNNGNNRLYGANAGVRLTIDAGQTIFGAGQIGLGQLRITNQGTITAQGSAGLTFNIVNAAGAFDNTGGVIEVADGSFARFSAGSIEGGTLRGNTTSLLRGAVGATLNGVNLEGALTLANGEGIGIAGASLNTGTLTLASAGFFTDLRVNADASIGGNGTIALTNNGNNRIFGNAAGVRLTVGAGQTIAGAGQLGVNGLLAVTNQGTIAADGSAGLRLNFANAAGAFDNAGGVLEVRGASTLIFDAGRFEGGTLRGTAADAILAGSTGATLVGTSIEGTLTLANGNGLGIGGAMSNSGTLTLASAGFFTDLRVNEDASISGNGSVVLTNNGNNRIYAAADGLRLTVGAGQTIAGAGQLGVNGLLKVTNQGTIAADGSAGLRLNFATTAGSFINTSGVLEVRNGSIMIFDAGRFEGGTLRGTTADARLAGSVAATLVGTIIEGTLTLTNGNGIGIGGDLVNTGTLSLASAGFFTDLRVNEDASIVGNGSILLVTNNGNNRIYAAADGLRLTLGSDQTIAGAGQLGVNNLLRVTNQGTIAAEGSTGLRLNFASAAGSFINTGGLLEVRGGSVLDFASGRFEGGTLRGTGIDPGLAGSVGATLVDTTIEGALTLRNGNGVSLAGTITNQGTLTMSSAGFFTDLRMTADTTLTGNGSILMSSNGNNRIYGATGAERVTVGAGQTVAGSGQIGVNQLRITNEGTIIANQPVGLTINPTGSEALINRGTLRVETGSSMTVTGSNIVQDDLTAKTLVHGTLTVPVLDLQAGLVGGTGRIIGALNNSGGTVAPGASPGTLIIQGNYTQGENGTLALEIDGPVQGVQHDWLSITGNASLNGALTLAFGYTPTVGTSYIVLTTGGTRSGEFASVAGPNGWDIDVLYGANNVTLTVVAVPEPGAYAMMLAGLALMGFVVMRRRRDAET
ncbi:MAG: PEP-CTERM sorting domain-containing protein [Burkholderiales bacterium]